jgi:hypothetical protein
VRFFAKILIFERIAEPKQGYLVRFLHNEMTILLLVPAKTRQIKELHVLKRRSKCRAQKNPALSSLPHYSSLYPAALI